ncbi:hypothetical protein ALC53_10509 [Atta colombica]|uniref:Uncharacterized protein n=1 Tax=Atta colombica TaxID=520822 RepID=A0A195B3V6_9HYME|nr:hypothetical protein ALC53_10509 [Atta colombica]
MGLETARKIANGQRAREKRERKARRIYWIGKIDASPDRTFRVPVRATRKKEIAGITLAPSSAPGFPLYGSLLRRNPSLSAVRLQTPRLGHAQRYLNARFRSFADLWFRGTRWEGSTRITSCSNSANGPSRKHRYFIICSPLTLPVHRAWSLKTPSTQTKIDMLYIKVTYQRGNYPRLILVESREYSPDNEPVAFLVPSHPQNCLYAPAARTLPLQRGAGRTGKKGCKVFQRSDAARLRSKGGRAPLSRRKGETRKAAERSRRRPAVSPAAKSELGRRQGRWSADYGSHLSKPGGNLPPRALCFLLWHIAKAVSLAVELVPYLSRMFIAYLTKLDSD